MTRPSTKEELKAFKALQIKQQLEAIWSWKRLSSPFFKALWTTTRDAEVVVRKTKEKIPDDELTG